MINCKKWHKNSLLQKVEHCCCEKTRAEAKKEVERQKQEVANKNQNIRKKKSRRGGQTKTKHENGEEEKDTTRKRQPPRPWIHCCENLKTLIMMMIRREGGDGRKNCAETTRKVRRWGFVANLLLALLQRNLVITVFRYYSEGSVAKVPC